MSCSVVFSETFDADGPVEHVHSFHLSLFVFQVLLDLLDYVLVTSMRLVHLPPPLSFSFFLFSLLVLDRKCHIETIEETNTLVLEGCRGFKKFSVNLAGQHGPYCTSIRFNGFFEIEAGALGAEQGHKGTRPEMN